MIEEREQDGQQPAAEPQLLDVFDAAWDIAAKNGRCDDRGSVEYHRVRAEWDRLYGKLVALDFIANRANQPPPPKTTS